MKLTVLGSCSAYPGPGAACSGYLVEEGSTKLLIDCGTGVLSNLQRVYMLEYLTHIVISHLHPDHFFDLIPYRYALVRPVYKTLHPRLYLPPGGSAKLRESFSVFDSSLIALSNSLEMEEYDPASLLKVGDLSIQFAPVKHYIPSFAMAICSSQKIVYSADSGPCDELATLVKSVDLFLCEATRCETDDAEWGHLSACEAATLAKRAEVKRLILTHFWPDCDYSQNLEQARAIFGEELEVAAELRTYNV